MFFVHKMEDNIIKMSVPPKLINRVNAIPIEIPIHVPVEIDKLILHFKQKCKRPRITTRHEVGGLILSGFETNYKYVHIKL